MNIYLAGIEKFIFTEYLSVSVSEQTQKNENVVRRELNQSGPKPGKLSLRAYVGSEGETHQQPSTGTNL